MAVSFVRSFLWNGIALHAALEVGKRVTAVLGPPLHKIFFEMRIIDKIKLNLRSLSILTKNLSLRRVLKVIRVFFANLSDLKMGTRWVPGAIAAVLVASLLQVELSSIAAGFATEIALKNRRLSKRIRKLYKAHLSPVAKWAKTSFGERAGNPSRVFLIR